MTQLGPDGPESPNSEQVIRWVTPIDGRPVEFGWPDPGGPLTLRAHLAFVDGRLTMVGLDIRSFTERTTEGGDIEREPGPAGLLPIDHAALRDLRAGAIAEEARTQARTLAAMASMRRDADRRGVAEEVVHQELAEQMAGALRTVAASSPSVQLALVAELYQAALAAGGEDARRPAKYVERALLDLGQEVTPGQVRGQIHRARVKGLIPREE